MIWIIIGVVALLVIWTVAIYNRLVNLKLRRENAFADIDVQLKQRHDLIPQLIGSVKGYMKHEEGVLTKVTEARTNAINASGVNDKVKAENELTRALSGLNVQVEAYPDLKANENFMHLQREISDIENKLASVRRFFNSATRELNTAIQTFPNNMLAGMFGFTDQPMFDVGADRAAMEERPEVNF